MKCMLNTSRSRLVLFVVICQVFVFTACGGGSGGQSSSQEIDRQLVVDSVRYLGIVESDSQIVAQDVGYSARVDGRIVWVFGDTILNVPNENNQHVLCNSWSYTYDLDAGDGVARLEVNSDAVGAPSVLIPLTASEKEYNVRHDKHNCLEEPCGSRWAIWPGAIISDKSEQTAYIFYHKMMVENAPLDFYHVGHSVAVWKNFSQSAVRPVLGLYDEFPTLMFSQNDTWVGDGFGSGALRVGDYFYIYGCEFKLELMASPCALARVPEQGILDRAKWQVYTGDDWSFDLEQATTVMNGSVMMTVFYSEYFDLYMAVYSKPVSDDIVMRTARQPWGPWSDQKLLFTAVAPESGVGWVYDGLAHPELSSDGGRTLYITYTRETRPLVSEMKLVEVTLGLR